LRYLIVCDNRRLEDIATASRHAPEDHLIVCDIRRLEDVTRRNGRNDSHPRSSGSVWMLLYNVQELRRSFAPCGFTLFSLHELAVTLISMMPQCKWVHAILGLRSIGASSITLLAATIAFWMNALSHMNADDSDVISWARVCEVQVRVRVSCHWSYTSSCGFSNTQWRVAWILVCSVHVILV
jgi:hypothetical protein